MYSSIVINSLAAIFVLSVLTFAPYCRADQNATAGSEDVGVINSSAAAGIIGALGSLIGYFGAEAADEVNFERLLWPERFYNDVSFAALCKIALSMTMGGPLNKAGLHALGSFAKNRLYRGPRQGNMLGTPFFSALPIKYRDQTNNQEDDVRNALLIRVLRLARVSPPRSTPADGESGPVPHKTRTIVPVHHLFLRYASDREEGVRVSEKFSWQTWFGLVLSETSALVVAAVVAIKLRSWFAVYWCVPLALKLIAALFCMRRNPIERTDSPPTHMFEVLDISDGFFLIEGPEPLVTQFFRHLVTPVEIGASTELVTDSGRISA